MRRGEAAFAWGVLLFALAMAIGAMVAYGDQMTVLRFPVGAGVLVAGLCAWRLCRPGAPEAGEESVAGPALRLASVVPLVWLLGYGAGLAAYALLALRWGGERWPAALAGAGLAAGLAALFLLVLEVPLPMALLPWR